MTEQNTTPETDESNPVPEMVPGSSGMYSISAADGIKMGPAVLQAFMQELRKAADAAKLEVKVEPLQGVLMIWWYPQEEKTFLDDIVQHMSAVPEGELEATEEQLFVGGVTNMNELHDYFNRIGEAKNSSIWINEVQQLGEKKHLKIRWSSKVMEPTVEIKVEVEEFQKAVVESYIDTIFVTSAKGNHTVQRTDLIPFDSGLEELKEIFEVACSKRALVGEMHFHAPTELLTFTWRPKTKEDIPVRTYLDAVVEAIDAEERGSTTASKALLLGPDDNIRTMQQLMAFWEMTGELKQKAIRMVHTGGGDEVHLSWVPLSEAGPMDDLNLDPIEYPEDTTWS